MPVGDLASQTIHGLRQLIQAGTVSPAEILDDLLARIEQLNDANKIHAYLDIDAERIRRQLVDVLQVLMLLLE